MRGLGASLQLLTRLPVPWPREHREGELAGALPWFPVVGALLGVLLGVGGWWLTRIGLPVGPAAVMTGVVAGPMLTGALHEDGLADTADGLWGGRDRAATLRILRDSRVGSYGVVALVAALLARVACLDALPPATWPAALAVGHSLGRLSTVWLMAALPYARAEEQGLGGTMVALLRPRHLVLASAVGVGVVILAPPPGLAALGLALLIMALLRRWFRRKLGGVTGDLLGATCIIVEVSTLLLWCLHRSS